MPKQFGLKNKGTKQHRSSFKYERLDPNKLRQRAERSGGNFISIWKDNVPRYNMESGDNSFRILPPTWDNREHFGYTLWVHSWIGAAKATYLCLQKMLNKRCPLCTAAAELEKSGEDEEAKSWRAKERVAYYVLDRNEGDNIPKVLDVSWSLDREICAHMEDKKTHTWLPIEDPDEGYDVFVRRTGKMLQTRYVGIQVDRESSPLCDDQKEQDRILETITESPIPTLLRYYSAETLEAACRGADEAPDELDEDEESNTEAESENEAKEARSSKRRAKADDDDDEEDEAPRKKRRAPPPEDEEDEVDEDQADDDEGVEEEAPKSRKRRAAPPRDEEDDEEDDGGGSGDEATDDDEDANADDDEEEAKPRTRRGGREERVSAKNGHRDDDDDNEEPADDDEGEEDEDERPKRRTTTRVMPKTAKRVSRR